MLGEVDFVLDKDPKDITVESLGYIVSSSGEIIEVDLEKDHCEVYSDFIISHKIPPETKISREKGYEILTNNGCVVYYGPYFRDELINNKDGYKNGIYYYKYNHDPNKPKRNNLYGVCYLPNNNLYHLSLTQIAFIYKLRESNITNGHEICKLCFGYPLQGEIPEYEFEKFIKDEIKRIRK